MNSAVWPVVPGLESRGTEPESGLSQLSRFAALGYWPTFLCTCFLQFLHHHSWCLQQPSGWELNTLASQSLDLQTSSDLFLSPTEDTHSHCHNLNWVISKYIISKISASSILLSNHPPIYLQLSHSSGAHCHLFETLTTISSPSVPSHVLTSHLIQLRFQASSLFLLSCKHC